jgi:serine/threonine-protein kinase
VPDPLDTLQQALSDRYRVVRELGRGGMAAVYLVEDLKNRRQVALKVLLPELAQTLGAQRFLREIEVAARLTHPNILPLHDSGEAEGLLYYAMPYVEGESLRDRMNREKQLPIDEALQITREVADALATAHSRGVIHRDIKPENILLEEGHAVVSDFGIARAIGEAGGEKLTQTGLAIGTPAYMSPEQTGGDHDIDGRSDIYSLGCVTYEMLVGEPPVTGPTPQAILARKLSEPTPGIQTVRETVPDAVEEAVLRALAKVPADRFATMREFADALVAPPSAKQGPIPSPRRRRLTAAGRDRAA